MGQDNGLTIGKFEIPSPCGVPWDSMAMDGLGRRHCAQCQHVVHDLTGMSTAEIERLYVRSGGKLCGSVRLTDDGQPMIYESDTSPRRVRLLRRWLVAAGLLLAYAQPQGSLARNASTAIHQPISAPPTDPESSIGPEPTGKTTLSPATNTLLSGVVMVSEYQSAEDDLEVDLYHGDTLITTVIASAGLFAHDFAGQFTPDDSITVHVRAKDINKGQVYRERNYGEASVTTRLGDAQNLGIRVSYHREYIKMAGKMMPRR